ncbi:MAG: phage terminase large subunit family protein [Patescibacteria group bacterium]|jgi:hypothetical protein
MDNEGELKAQIENKTKQAKKKIETSWPLLYWSMEYHRNSKGKKMDFNDAWFLIDLYKNILKWPYFVAKKSAQCFISELMIVLSLYEAGVLGFCIMYSLPNDNLKRRFVNNRVDKALREIPFYVKLYDDAKGVKRTELKHFGRGSIAYINSRNEKEYIEIPVDASTVDEKDRCDMANLEMIKDRMIASEYGYQREISNPSIEGYGVDYRYEQYSTQGKYNIRCNCGEWVVPDFFVNVVRQVGERKWEAIDPNYVKNQTPDINVYCHHCWKPIDRLKKGEWVEKYPDKLWVGREIGSLISKAKGCRPGVLVDEWIDVCGHDQKTQLFYNFKLGLAYTSAGAKITETSLLSCQERYSFPIRKEDVKGVLFMGVDVGSVLNVVIRERIIIGSVIKLRLVLVTTVASFSLLRDLITYWSPKIVVVDSKPEIHSVLDLKEWNKHVYLTKFQHGLLKIQINKQERMISMDRTCLLDMVKESFDKQVYVIPEGFETIDGGDYVAHLKASTRVLLLDEAHPEKSYYSWEHSMPDHYFLSESFCLQASIIDPGGNVLDFYKKWVVEINTEKDKVVKEVVRQTNESEDSARSKLNVPIGISPTHYLSMLQNKYAERKKK